MDLTLIVLPLRLPLFMYDKGGYHMLSEGRG